jgi:hypothetical protein
MMIKSEPMKMTMTAMMMTAKMAMAAMTMAAMTMKMMIVITCTIHCSGPRWIQNCKRPAFEGAMTDSTWSRTALSSGFLRET